MKIIYGSYFTHMYNRELHFLHKRHHHSVIWVPISVSRN